MKVPGQNSTGKWSKMDFFWELSKSNAVRAWPFCCPQRTRSAPRLTAVCSGCSGRCKQTQTWCFGAGFFDYSRHHEHQNRKVDGRMQAKNTTTYVWNSVTLFGWSKVTISKLLQMWSWSSSGFGSLHFAFPLRLEAMIQNLDHSCDPYKSAPPATYWPSSSGVRLFLLWLFLFASARAFFWVRRLSIARHLVAICIPTGTPRDVEMNSAHSIAQIEFRNCDRNIAIAIVISVSILEIHILKIWLNITFLY